MKNENNPYLPKTFFYLDFFFLSFFSTHKKKRTTQHTYTIVTYSAENKMKRYGEQKAEINMHGKTPRRKTKRILYSFFAKKITEHTHTHTCKVQLNRRYYMINRVAQNTAA